MRQNWNIQNLHRSNKGRRGSPSLAVGICFDELRIIIRHVDADRETSEDEENRQSPKDGTIRFGKNCSWILGLQTRRKKPRKNGLYLALFRDKTLFIQFAQMVDFSPRQQSWRHTRVPQPQKRLETNNKEIREIDRDLLRDTWW